MEALKDLPVEVTTNVDVCVMGELSQSATRANILVVDDEYGPRQAVRMLLNEDHEVFTAEDVPSAQAVLEKERIDLVITDIRMPKQTGVDLLQWIKATRPETEVIILTGYGELETAVKAVEYGALAYIEKPFDADTMLRHVEEGLDKYRREQERQRMEHLALEANRFETLGRFVSGMLHDLGTPLAVMSGQLELVLAQSDSHGVTDRLKAMQSQTALCTDIVRSAMNFLRYQSQRFTVLNINDLVESCMSVSQPLFKKFGVHTLIDIGGDMPSCMGDYVLMRQAVLNLFTNACQAMERQKPPREIHVRTWREDDHVCISVSDSGPGIAEEDIQKIFDAFYSTKGDNGTGLGLAAVKNIMRRHNGDVSVGKSDQGGAVFVLKFPLAGSENES